MVNQTRVRTALILTCVTLTLVSGVAGTGVSNARGIHVEVWNSDPDFDLPAFDTGDLLDVCHTGAPWGAGSWGTESSSWVNPPAYSIDKARFSASGSDGELNARDESGNWSFARFIQGDVWGGSNCGPIVWNVPAPLLTHGVDSTISIDIYRSMSDLLSPTSSWVMFALNIWLTSPEFPTGPDKTGHKPLVMDLAFYLDCNWGGCGLHSFEDTYGYHYQALVGETPFEQWETWSVDLDDYIQQALAYPWPSGSIAYAEDTLEIFQLEFVIEVYNSEGAARIDDFALRYEGDPTAITVKSFTAAAANPAIQLGWETETEVHNLGFNLYRRDSRGVAWLRLNDELIPSQVPPGAPFGAFYTWLDESVQPGVVFHYILEDVDIYGRATRHGPVKASTEMADIATMP